MTCTRPVRLEKMDLTVPCGHCINCRIAHSREWAVRIIHEMENYEFSSFVTLTYKDESLPEGGSLVIRDLQLFFKRLRKSLDGRKIKYFACGEYGEKKDRPHYHAIILGLRMDEKNIVEKCWPNGLVHIGTVTYDSARYTADYVMKKYNGNKAKQEYGNKQGPFQLTSKGMGKDFALDNQEYIKNKKGITLYGQEVGIPRYYKKVLNLNADFLAEDAKERWKELNDQFGKLGENDDQVIKAYKASNRQKNINAKRKIQLRHDRKKGL